MLTKVRVWFNQIEVSHDEDYEDVIVSIDDEEFDGMTDDDIIEVAKQKFSEEYKYPADFECEDTSIVISDVDSNENYICIKDSKTEITQRDCPGTNEQTMGIFENYKEK